MSAKTCLLLAGGASAALAFYCLRKDAEPSKVEVQDPGVPKLEEISKETVLQMLEEIIQAQDELKHHTKQLTTEIRKHNWGLEQTYEDIKRRQPPDTLDKHGLTTMDFDQLLDKYMSDQKIREAIARVMGRPSGMGTTSERAQQINVQMIIEVHKFMVDELEKLVQNLQSIPTRDTYNPKTVAIATQTIISARMEDKFQLTVDDLENAVLMHHTLLCTDQDFATINIKIQHLVGKMMGAPYNNSLESAATPSGSS